MRDCMVSKLRLPDLNGIRIDYISSADEDLSSFLSKCIPARLNLLAINFLVNISTGIKSKFYVKAFSEAARRTTKEVLFSCIDFREEDLQTVVRAARNVERIVFDFCCIHYSSGLDFGANLSYNTKFLSFQNWGRTDFIERTTDWKTDPSSFSLVVDAIGSSGLRASLEKLSIYASQTLSVPNVQEEMSSKGMSQISVVEENSFQLLS